jgi:hypothetical protein
MKPESNISRQYTNTEIQEIFLKQLWTLVDYWDKEPIYKNQRERMIGLVFSVLSTIDGCGYLPRFNLIPDPHPSDKEYNISIGNNYFPDCTVDITNNISGTLHDNWFQYKTS